MECQNCELRQRQFYCENCLKQHLLSLRLQISHAATERDAQVSASNKSLRTAVEPQRFRRADLKATEERVREIWEGLELVRKANESTREHIQAKRDSLSARRRTLAMASSPDLPSSSSSSSTSSSPSPAYSHSPPNNSARPFLAQVHRRLSSTSQPQSQPHASTSPSSRPSSAATLMRQTQITRSVSASPQINSNTAPSPPSLLSTQPFPQTSRGLAYVQAAHATIAEQDKDKNIQRQIEEAQFQLNALSDTIARARSGLVQELVEVFSVVEVGGRPPLGGKAGTKGEWTIGGLVLPVPGDMRRYPPDHINAVLTHTLHFLFLLAFYLGIKLPFEVVWSRSSTPPSSSGVMTSTNSNTLGRDAEKPNGLLGVGTPWIGAIRGSESGGWARWSTKHPLHVSANPPSTSGVATTVLPSQTRPGLSHVRAASALTMATRSKSVQSPTGTDTPSSGSMDDSHIDIDDPSAAVASSATTGTTSASGSSFTTALAMLLYDVCYLAYTQGVDVSLAQAGEVLGNLWAVCCSSELGRKSHATHPLVPAPTPPSFPLDFTQLLQATAANPSRAKARGAPGREGLVRQREREERERDRIVEEEDGWDLVDDVGQS